MVVKSYGLTRMALKLGLCFSRFAFPIAVAVRRVFELVTGLSQIGAGLRAALDRPWLTSAWSVWDEVGRNRLD